jgi:hypothetical protein
MVRWVVEYLRPANIVNDEPLHAIVKTGPGRQDVWIPSESTVMRDVRRAYRLGRVQVKAFFEVSSAVFY